MLPLIKSAQKRKNIYSLASAGCFLIASLLFSTSANVDEPMFFILFGIAHLIACVAFVCAAYKKNKELNELENKMRKDIGKNAKPTNSDKCDMQTRRKAFIGYVVGSVIEWGYFTHNRFNDDNLIDGLNWASGQTNYSFSIISMTECENYIRKGKLNIYKPQILNPINSVLMDLFELLIFGEYQEDDMSDSLPSELIQAMKVKLWQVHQILNGDEICNYFAILWDDILSKTKELEDNTSFEDSFHDKLKKVQQQAETSFNYQYVFTSLRQSYFLVDFDLLYDNISSTKSFLNMCASIVVKELGFRRNESFFNLDFIFGENLEGDRSIIIMFEGPWNAEAECNYAALYQKQNGEKFIYTSELYADDDVFILCREMSDGSRENLGEEVEDLESFMELINQEELFSFL